MGYLKSGNSILAWGHVSGKDARFKRFDSGKCVTNFSICYGYGESDGQGRRPGKFMDVKVWNDHAEDAAGLEKGDILLVAGELKKEREPDRDGNDRYYLDAGFFAVQPTYASAFAEEEPQEESGGLKELPEDYGGELPDFLA